MAFGIPNEADASFAPQASPDAQDIAVLVAALNGTGVVSGCAVTAQGSPDMTLAVAVGIVASAGSAVAVAAGNVTITTADATNPRFDLVTVSALGVKTVTAGTAAAAPVFPALPSGHAALAAVYVPAGDTAIGSTQIVDKRAVVPDLFNRTAPLLEDDFASGRLDSGYTSVLGWFNSGTWAYVAAEASHPGIARCTSAASNPSTAGLYAANTTSIGAFLPADLFDLLWIVRYGIGAGAANQTLLRVGASDDPATSGTPANGVYLEKLAADTNWFAVCRAASTETRSTTSVAASAATWYALRARRDTAGGNILFTVNGGDDISVGTNIPTATLMPGGAIRTSETVAKTLDVDYFRLRLTGLAR